jgi:hypothetical protein
MVMHHSFEYEKHSQETDFIMFQRESSKDIT